MAIYALHVSAEFLGKFFLQTAHRFDGFVGHLQSLKQSAFRHFVHFAFHHHDVFFGGTDHDVHIGVGELFECRVNDIFAVDAGYAHLRDGSFERNVGAGQSSRSGETSECVRHVNAIG